jgi:hypothetical protein
MNDNGLHFHPNKGRSSRVLLVTTNAQVLKEPTFSQSSQEIDQECVQHRISGLSLMALLVSVKHCPTILEPSGLFSRSKIGNSKRIRRSDLWKFLRSHLIKAISP